MMLTFPYSKSAIGESFPLVNFILYHKNHLVRASALIDSGAVISIFREEVDEMLGIKIENGKEIYLGGIGSKIKGYIHKVEIEIADKKFKFPIVFSHEYKVSFNLLGRDNFFNKFKITFDEKKNYLKLE